MNKIKEEMLRKLYIDKLSSAQGKMTLNDFARRAGISPGNFSKMLSGQIARPATLKKVADARPDLECLYDELMYAAGYVSRDTKNHKVSSPGFNDVRGRVIALPILKTLKGKKSSLISTNSCGTYYLNKTDLEHEQSFVYCVNDDGLAPHINIGDMIVFDSLKLPKNGDIVLFRTEGEKGLVRYYCSTHSKIIAYGASREQMPEYFTKSNVEVLGVATKALLNL